MMQVEHPSPASLNVARVFALANGLPENDPGTLRLAAALDKNRDQRTDRVRWINGENIRQTPRDIPDQRDLLGFMQTLHALARAESLRIDLIRLGLEALTNHSHTEVQRWDTAMEFYEIISDEELLLLAAKWWGEVEYPRDPWAWLEMYAKRDQYESASHLGD
jgi:hypothetical protein